MEGRNKGGHTHTHMTHHWATAAAATAARQNDRVKGRDRVKGDVKER